MFFFVFFGLSKSRVWRFLNYSHEGYLFVYLSCFDDDHDDHNRACCNGVDTKLLSSLVAWVDDQPYDMTNKVVGSIPS